MSLRELRFASVAGMVVLMSVVGGCRDHGSRSRAATDVTICNPDGTEQADADLPAVATIATAIAALESELGGPQQYFEVNATARVVNLFVALNGATVAKAWLFADGALTSRGAQQAKGGTFTKADLRFQAENVFTAVRRQVPEAILETFYVNGDGKGNVKYGILTSARCGGGLDIVVGPDGVVKSVEPVR